MKGHSILLVLLLVLLVGCQKEGKFDLSREQATAQALKSGPSGEIADIVGDPGPYRPAARMYTAIPVDKNDKSEGSEGVTFAGHSLNYSTSSTEYYHVISTFETASGGGLLIGTRHPVDQSRYAKITEIKSVEQAGHGDGE